MDLVGGVVLGEGLTLGREELLAAGSAGHVGERYRSAACLVLRDIGDVLLGEPGM